MEPWTTGGSCGTLVWSLTSKQEVSLHGDPHSQWCHNRRCRAYGRIAMAVRAGLARL